MSRKILVTGCRGQIGSALLKIFKEYAVGIDVEDLDLTKIELIRPYLDKINPKVIINCAAYTQVDKAETERELAMVINAQAPHEMAKWCKAQDLPFVHYSTDYVYPGTGVEVMTEDHDRSPCNYYGETKLAGDKKILSTEGKILIFRTCWVYDASGKNFMNTILRLASEKEELTIVNDQIGSPSFASDIARGTVDALSLASKMTKFPSGVYHICSSEYTNWCEFAEKIVSSAKDMGQKFKVNKISAISSEQYKSPAKRPKNSRLSCEKLKRVFGISLPSWQDGLNRCLKEKYAN